MTQEDKELLLKDLSARLPYKPKIKVSSLWNENKEVEEDIVDSVYCVMPDGYINTETIDSDISFDNIVLYLRPMSSMTEEEKRTYTSLRAHAAPFTIVNWLDENHFDHRTNTEGEHLIELGIALEAPEGMYEY